MLLKKSNSPTPSVLRKIGEHFYLGLLQPQARSALPSSNTEGVGELDI
jgi:hypothetical protein